MISYFTAKPFKCHLRSKLISKSVDCTFLKIGRLWSILRLSKREVHWNLAIFLTLSIPTFNTALYNIPSGQTKGEIQSYFNNKKKIGKRI